MTTTPVTESTDPLLDDYRQLNDQAFRRRYEGDRTFITEGYVAIDRLIESGHTIRSVLLAPSRVERFAANAAVLEARGVPIYVAEREVIARTVGFDLHRGVIAVLEGLNDAENLGAIARAARAFGIDGLVVDHTCTDPFSRRTVRVSMGEVLTLPIGRAEPGAWREVVPALRQAGFETWAMTPAPDAADLWQLEVPERAAVVLGAEGPGLSRSVMAAADRRVRIPISPTVDSLNVAQAAAVTFAALSRPR